MLKRTTLAALGISSLAAFMASNAVAAELGGVKLDGSGFLTLGIGKMLGGTRGNVSDFECPCFIADYAQAGVYDGRGSLQARPDSKLGLQGTASIDDGKYSLTGQIVSRGARSGRVNLEWIYASARVSDTLTLQVGRKRLPMFYYSETQDLGLTLPWAHLPPQLYGWEAVNYNGANLYYRDQWGEWSAASNLLVGREFKKESGYWKIYNGKLNRTDIKWDNILGADLTLSRDWFETRLVYIQSKTRTKNVSGTWVPEAQQYDPETIDAEFTPPAHQKIFGIALNADYQNWLFRSEFIHINRPGQTFKDFAQIIAAGYRWGKWQPLVTWSRYKGSAVTDQGGDPDGQEQHATWAFTLRYDLTSSSALKLQYDSQRDRSGPNWAPNYGDARLLTLTYDIVF